MLARLALLATLLLPGLAMAETAFDFAFKKLEGGELPLSAYKGKALLVVNTASFCGFTSQYEGMVKLWDTYRERGLVVIGVPSNDFNQEPGAAGEESPSMKASAPEGASGRGSLVSGGSVRPSSSGGVGTASSSAAASVGAVAPGGVMR